MSVLKDLLPGKLFYEAAKHRVQFNPKMMKQGQKQPAMKYVKKKKI